MQGYKMGSIYLAELYKARKDMPDVFSGERSLLVDTGIKVGAEGQSKIYKNALSNSSYEILSGDDKIVYSLKEDLSLTACGKVEDFESLESLINHVSNLIDEDSDLFDDENFKYDSDSIDEALTRVLLSFDKNDEISEAHLALLVDDIIMLSNAELFYNEAMEQADEFEEDDDGDYPDSDEAIM